MTTVKLDDDIVEALHKVRSGPLSREVNNRLRLSLNPKPAPKPKARSTSSANLNRPYPPQADCVHPPGARIGTLCGRCGATVPGPSKR